MKDDVVGWVVKGFIVVRKKYVLLSNVTNAGHARLLSTCTAQKYVTPPRHLMVLKKVTSKMCKKTILKVVQVKPKTGKSPGNSESEHFLMVKKIKKIPETENTTRIINSENYATT